MENLSGDGGEFVEGDISSTRGPLHFAEAVVHIPSPLWIIGR